MNTDKNVLYIFGNKMQEEFFIHVKKAVMTANDCLSGCPLTDSDPDLSFMGKQGNIVDAFDAAKALQQLLFL